MISLATVHFLNITVIILYVKRSTAMGVSQRRAGLGPVADKNGVMMFDYGDPLGVLYNPTVVAEYGLYYYDSYQRTGDLKARQNLINTANWLLDHAKEYRCPHGSCGRYSLWEYGFKWPWYGGIDPPYASALAQAEGVNVLMMAHEMLPWYDRYPAEARKAFGAFLVDYDDGGVASNEGNDSIFLQLLAKPGFPKTYVLNGHTNSLIFVWKYYQYTHDYRALIVFGKGINWLAIEDNLKKYDAGDWSYYDQLGNRAHGNYHQGHINQLARLYEITREPILKRYCDRFAACIR
jgi:hypothetical protein